jgi:hypothetical protein
MEAVQSRIPAFEPAALASHHFGLARLFDKRRTERLVKTAQVIMSHPQGTLPAKLADRADLAGLYRLASCESVTHARVLETHHHRTREAMADHPGVVLVIHDWTELDFSDIEQLADELGQIGTGNRRGYLCHNSLAVALESDGQRKVLGLAAQVLHKRRLVPKDETPSQKRRHPDRESRLWLAGCQQVGAAPAGKRWVDIADRGADTFEFLSYQIDSGRHFVVRCAKDRRLAGEDHLGSDRVYQKLKAYMADLPDLGRRQVQAAAGPGKKARLATVAVAAGAIRLATPDFARGDYQERPLDLWAVHVREVDAPPGTQPLEWLLLSDLPAGNAQQAWELVDYYEHRPLIEDYHKGQKSGLGIQLPRFTAAAHLEPVIALLSVVAAVLLGLRDAARSSEGQHTAARDRMPAVYVKVLAAVSAKRAASHGPRAKAPVTADMSVAQFVIELAKLGGFLARKSDGHPGWQTLWRGWEKLQLMVDGAIAMFGEKCVYE